MTPTLDLAKRDGLPDTLQVLLEAFPREIWERHHNFNGMVRFWLERHLMFRDVLDGLMTDAEQSIDGNISVERYASRLSRLGGFFLTQLHGHHQIEDLHYFPKLVTLDRRLTGGFDILESDHDMLESALNAFASAANDILETPNRSGDFRDKVGRFHGDLAGFAAMLNRHLEDEEDLIVPVILSSGFNDQ
jgi:hypothetical protein